MEQIKQGLLFEGKLSVDRNDRTSARLFVRKGGFEIRVVDTNRAMHGDRVAVQLLPEQSWKKEEAQREVRFEEEEGEAPSTNPEEEMNDVQRLQELYKAIVGSQRVPVGRVVGVLGRVDRRFCGHCMPDDERGYLLVPADPRYPEFRLLSSRQLLGKKVEVSLLDWPAWSAHPRAKLCQVLGEAGDIRVEGNVILLEHQVEIREFSREVMACLPIEGERWQIPPEELARRLDLRHLGVCSIDPVGCRDIDDALHCRTLPNGNFEVGVHIADVSHFVRPDTPIDREAAHRCTTVYLVDRRTDMLPKLLTENLCSLVANVDHLTFSVLWEIDAQGRIVNVSFAKSVIRSRAALHYAQAQAMIDDPHDSSELAISIRHLNALAKQLKA